MRERLVYLALDESIPDSGMFVKNIDIVDPITQIDILIKNQTGATSCLDHEIHDDISRIEVIDGGDVLHALTMIEEQALNCFERGQFPWFDFDEGAAKTVREGCHIMFGRSARDEEINFRPTAYKNPQLRITHDFTISATVGFETNKAEITVVAHVLEDVAAAHKGFLMTKEHYSYTTVTTAHEYVDMPVDYTYRLIMLKHLLTTKRQVEILDNIKLHCDREKFVKMSMDCGDIIRTNFDQWTGFNQKKHLFSENEGTALLDIYNILDQDIEALLADQIAGIEAIAGEQITHSLIDFTAVATPAWQATETDVLVSLEGLEPHACLCLLMGDLQQPEDWFDVSVYGTVTLDILSLLADAAGAVVIQQLRP